MKNVLRVIRNSYFILFLFLLSCSKRTDLVLVNSSKENAIDFPETMDLTYNGFKIGEATCISEKGDYNIVFTTEVRTSCESDYLLIKDDAFGFSYHIDVSHVLKGKNKSDSEIVDTCYYVVKEDYEGKERVDNIVNTFKEIVDTLSNKRNDTLN